MGLDFYIANIHDYCKKEMRIPYNLFDCVIFVSRY